MKKQEKIITIKESEYADFKQWLKQKEEDSKVQQTENEIEKFQKSFESLYTKLDNLMFGAAWDIACPDIYDSEDADDVLRDVADVKKDMQRVELAVKKIYDLLNDIENKANEIKRGKKNGN